MCSAKRGAGPRTPIVAPSERKGAPATRAPGSTSTKTSRSCAHGVSASSCTVRTSATRNPNCSNRASSVGKSGTCAQRSARIRSASSRDSVYGTGTSVRAAATSSSRRVRIAHERDLGAVGDREDRVVPRVGDPRSVVPGEIGRRPLVGVHERLGHRDVEVLATTGALALEQRGDDAAHREQPGGDVAVDVRALLRRRVAQPGVELDPPDLGLHHRRVGAPLRPRVVEAPPVDRAVDELGLAGQQRGGVEAVLLQRRRAGSSRAPRRSTRPAAGRARRPGRSGGRPRSSASRRWPR